MRNIAVHGYDGHAFPLQLSRQLAKEGYRVAHAYAANLTTPRGDLQLRTSDPACLSIDAIPMSPRFADFKYDFARRWFLERDYGRAVCRWLAAQNPDVLLSGDAPIEVQAMLLRQCRAQGIPLVNWMQEVYSVSLMTLLRGWYAVPGSILGRYYRFLETAILTSSAHTIAISADFAALAQRWGANNDRITIIENWAPIEDLPLRPRDNEWARRHGLHDKFCFLYSGTLGLKHDIEPICRLARAFDAVEQVRIVVLSQGMGASRLAAIRDAEQLTSLCLLPYQPFGDFADVLATADVLLLLLNTAAAVTSVPSKVYSYMCAKRPILACAPIDNAATRLLRDQTMGIVARPGDYAAFIEAARRLLHDRSLRQEFGENARRYAEANFQITMISQRFLEVLQTVVRAEPSPVRHSK